MLANWFIRRFQLSTVKRAREELERFVDSLRRMSDEEVGAVLAFAAITRVALRKSGVLPDELLQVTLAQEQATAQLAVAQLVRRYQAERRFSEATGAMVWLHSLRALSIPEIRHLGREMWRHLQRGQLQARIALVAIGVKPLSNVTLESSRIPEDLHPDDEPGVPTEQKSGDAHEQGIRRGD